MKYVIKTPNEHYCGVTEGVDFENGVGSTSDENIRNILVNDYQYEDVTPKQKPEPKPKKAKPSGK